MEQERATYCTVQCSACSTYLYSELTCGVVSTEQHNDAFFSPPSVSLSLP